eukprot:365144-Chlamydomonas_euryale.AAC.5
MSATASDSFRGTAGSSSANPKRYQFSDRTTSAPDSFRGKVGSPSTHPDPSQFSDRTASAPDSFRGTAGSSPAALPHRRHAPASRQRATAWPEPAQFTHTQAGKSMCLSLLSFRTCRQAKACA